MDLSRYWKTIVDLLQDGILVVDPKGNIIAMNPAAERLTGYRAAELVGHSCRVLDCTGCQIFGRGAAEKWCGLYVKGEVQAKKCMITHKDRRTVNIIKNATILKDQAGQVIGAVETLTDMSEIVRKQEVINSLRKTLHLDEGYHGIIGQSAPMGRLFELIDNVSPTESPVMIHGESGTGKELVAQAVHDAGPRRDKPFIKVNCASLNENLLESELFGHAKGAYTGALQNRIGRFEAAHEGTIFLDEIGDIPPATQVKLLRVLEDKVIERVGDHRPIKVDVRVVSATNKNLEELIAAEQFREDLFFRINVFPLQIPSLRERTEDIPALVQYFIGQNNARTDKHISGLTPAAMEKMIAYGWPGNVRELRNSVEYAFVLCPPKGLIESDHLPPKIAGAPPECAEPAPAAKLQAGKSTADPKKEKLIRALMAAGGNQSEAARILGVSRVTVWKQIKKYGVTLSRDVV
ncbi:MAG: sigma 54-interacting transcriptional regulator [Desulfobacterales bacterium]